MTSETPGEAGGPPLTLGAGPSHGMGRVRGAAGSAARRRDDRDVSHRGGAATTQTAPRRREPAGHMGIAAPCFVARRQRCDQHRFLLASRLGLASPMCAAHAMTRTGSYLPTFTFMPLARAWPAAFATRASPPRSPSLISAVRSEEHT